MNKISQSAKVFGKQKFKLNDRVQLSDTWDEKSTKYPRTGTVVGFSRTGGSVRVLRDGQKTPSAWGAAFWDLEHTVTAIASVPISNGYDRARACFALAANDPQAVTTKERLDEFTPKYPVLFKPLTPWQKFKRFFTGND